MTIAGGAEGTRLSELEQVATVLTAGGMRMLYQPVVELATGAVVGYEALARFDSPLRRSPEAWFACAARAGLGAELESRAVELACTALEALAEPLALAVNVSPRTLCSAELRRVLAGVEPRRMVLEVTEHEIVEDHGTFNRCARRLRDHGFRVAVDDAGAGYADLARVIELAPDVVKVDRSLVSAVDRDGRKQATVGMLVAASDSLGATVVAEGIEREPEAETLRRFGVTLGQGFLYGRARPLPLSRQLTLGSTCSV